MSASPIVDQRSFRKPLRSPALLLGLLTLLLFGGGGAALTHWVQGRDLVALNTGPWNPWLQLATGTGVGTAMGLAALYLVHRRWMAPVIGRYSDMIGPWMQLRSQRILVSICAGVGEELFFRGAVQHWLGITITAVIFVAIHGYLDPRNWRISIYGLVLTAMMIALGWMAEHQGLLAPMAAHTMIDLVLLEGLYHAWRKKEGARTRIPTQGGDAPGTEPAKV